LLLLQLLYYKKISC